MAGKKRKRVYARVSDDVHDKLNEDASRASFGRIVQEMGEWMVRKGLPLDDAFDRLMGVFYAGGDENGSRPAA